MPKIKHTLDVNMAEPKEYLSSNSANSGLKKGKTLLLIFAGHFSLLESYFSDKMKLHKTDNKQLGLDNGSRRGKTSTLIASALNAKFCSMVMFYLNPAYILQHR